MTPRSCWPGWTFQTLESTCDGLIRTAPPLRLRLPWRWRHRNAMRSFAPYFSLTFAGRDPGRHALDHLGHDAVDSSGEGCRAERSPPACRFILACQGSPPRLDRARIEVAGRPTLAISSEPGRLLSLVADTHSLVIPKCIEGYSSQTLLWEMIRDELTRDPFLAVDNIDGYLNSRRARFQIGDDGFDAAIFIEQLIVPAVQQGLARRMIKDGMPLRIFGRGLRRHSTACRFPRRPSYLAPATGTDCFAIRRPGSPLAVDNRPCHRNDRSPGHPNKTHAQFPQRCPAGAQRHQLAAGEAGAGSFPGTDRENRSRISTELSRRSASRP